MKVGIKLLAGLKSFAEVSNCLGWCRRYRLGCEGLKLGHKASIQ